MAIERVLVGQLTDEDADLYSAALEIMAGACIQSTVDIHGVDRSALIELVCELKELERHYARMSLTKEDEQ
jgi:hypothetical protein